MLYEPEQDSRRFGVIVRHAPLKKTWGAWLPDHNLILIADGLTPAQERCTLAHHLEHYLAGHDLGCGTGPHADDPSVRAAFGIGTLLQERRADAESARKLLPSLDEIPTTAQGVEQLARQLGVTPHVVRTRIASEDRSSKWPGTSKTGG